VDGRAAQDWRPGKLLTGDEVPYEGFIEGGSWGLYMIEKSNLKSYYKC